jgi:hypothetical protein
VSQVEVSFTCRVLILSIVAKSFIEWSVDMMPQCVQYLFDLVQWVDHQKKSRLGGDGWLCVLSSSGIWHDAAWPLGTLRLFLHRFSSLSSYRGSLIGCIVCYCSLRILFLCVAAYIHLRFLLLWRIQKVSCESHNIASHEMVWTNMDAITLDLHDDDGTLLYLSIV